ncbi:MAG: penicillin-binding transpeptidase domain-containing protein [Candidatus Limivicinus sp.]|nr:penicillin-binding transpeptidase domain-containing protein [Clostridiales bacterium]MDY3860746.1 penicillin-binding transpeptidase domain-containing protein [Candidatus Limivicinus sp.]
MNRLVKPGRVAALVILIILVLTVYLVFLYQLQIVEGEKYYNRSSELTKTERTVTAARGNILDRYGRVLVSNAETYNLKIDTDKLFANEDPNAVILELVDMVAGYGDSYTDDLPITMEPPFEYTENMTAIQRTMLDAYYVRQKIDPNSTAVELMSFMRTRYEIDNSYTAEQMRIIAGVRYSINVRYAINTADYVFVEDASMELISSIMENKLVGIEVERAYTRKYGTDYAAHILGYVGLMTQEEYEKYSLLKYSTDAMVGKDGVEYAFENYLHGKDGKVEETRNASGTILATVYTEEPVPGNHIYLTIDGVLQEQTERILSNGVEILKQNIAQARAEGTARGDYNVDLKDNITGAAAVVVNVKTGEPLAMASWPTYNVATIIEDYQDLLEAENSPLFNRPLMGTYAPGSAFKPCTAIAALTKGIINTEKKIKCEGVFTKYAAEGYAPECWIWNATKDHLTHPEENVVDAIRDSCNYYFYTIGNDLGVDDMGEFAKAFGLGEYTGIELVEAKGNMSNQANHQDYAGTEWRIGDTLQAAIGQSDSVFTPIQMAEYCATVANSGTRYSSSILKSIRNYDYSEKLYDREPTVMSTVETADYNWDAVHQGMWKVLNDYVNEKNVEVWASCPWTVAGKTGTAQKGEGIQNDGIFMCYGPYKDPEVAIFVVVERGGAGASVQFIARQIMDAYITIRGYSDTSEAEMSLLK